MNLKYTYGKSITLLIAMSLFFAGCQRAENSDATANGATQNSSALNYSSGKAANLVYKSSLIEKIRKDNLGDQTIIFKIGNESVNVGDFKAGFKEMQAQMKLLLSQTPGMEQRMVDQAQKLNISLSSDEKTKLLNMAHAKMGPDLQKVLKEQNISSEEFDKQVLQMGLALKVISTTVEQSVLQQMVAKCLLIDGAYEAGLAKTAYSAFIDAKSSPQYKELLAVSDVTPAQLKEQLIKDGLVRAMQDRILQDLRLSDREVFEFYNSQKDMFSGEGKVRWSQIFIASPKAELKRKPELMAQIKANNPKMSDAEIHTKMDEADKGQKNKAIQDLRKVLTGYDFAKLANEDTNDPQAREAQTGGEMGYMPLKTLEENEVFAPIQKALLALSPGQIYPELIETPYGWHIIKLTAKPGDSIPFKEVKDGLKRELLNKSKESFVLQWIQKQQEAKKLDIAKEFSDCLTFSQS